MPSPARIAALLSLLPLAVHAQTHRVAAAEKVTRAVAVYEWTGDLGKPSASRLVPVSLFINGHFEDAGLYLAHPVPLALEPGDVYSVEQAGQEKGTLTLEHARDFSTGHLLEGQDPLAGWYGFGPFLPLAPPKPPPALHASAHPPVIVSSADPARPHLGDKTGDTSASKPGAGSPKDSATPAASDDSDRPTLGRKTSRSTDAPDSSTTDTPGDSKPTDKDKDPERPSLRKRTAENTGRRSPPTAGVTGPDRPLNDDPDRPTIRHGKTPTEQDAEDLKTLPADLHQSAAISDPVHRDPHLFAREWESPAERAEVLSRLQAVARTEAAGYLTQNHLTPGAAPAVAAPATPASPAKPGAPATPTPSDIPASADPNAPTLRRTPNGISTATPAAPAPVPPAAPTPSAKPAPPARGAAGARTSAAARARAAKAVKPVAPAPLTLTAEQLNGYLLTYGGLPTFAYTAQVPVTSGGPIYVTLLGQRLPSGEMQIALRSTTDAAHLDRTPWMRPIDAVDPDASHRASLLFELRAQHSRQFALYRLISAQADQQFLSQPIQ